MEFPELGANCALTTCKQLDFLPMKCDACAKLFCKEHIKYTEHNCENAYKKDIQVPVCPLCNKAVPVPRGEQPDIKVGDHIDRDCQSDPAVAKRKAYLNRCSVKGCKQKELVPVRCESCRQNFCLKHRHEQDHSCSAVVRGSAGSKTSASVKAGEAAAARAKSTSSKISRKPQQTSLSSIGRDLDRSRRERQEQPRSHQPIPQPAMSEDEALALAIQASLQDQSKVKPSNPTQTAQEDEDRALARALAESEREEQNRRRRQEQERKSDCRVT